MLARGRAAATAAAPRKPRSMPLPPSPPPPPPPLAQRRRRTSAPAAYKGEGGASGGGSSSASDAPTTTTSTTVAPPSRPLPPIDWRRHHLQILFVDASPGGARAKLAAALFERVAEWNGYGRALAATAAVVARPGGAENDADAGATTTTTATAAAALPLATAAALMRQASLLNLPPRDFARAAEVLDLPGDLDMHDVIVAVDEEARDAVLRAVEADYEEGAESSADDAPTGNAPSSSPTSSSPSSWPPRTARAALAYYGPRVRTLADYGAVALSDRAALARGGFALLPRSMRRALLKRPPAGLERDPAAAEAAEAEAEAVLAAAAAARRRRARKARPRMQWRFRPTTGGGGGVDISGTPITSGGGSSASGHSGGGSVSGGSSMASGDDEDEEEDAAAAVQRRLQQQQQQQQQQLSLGLRARPSISKATEGDGCNDDNDDDDEEQSAAAALAELRSAGSLPPPPDLSTPEGAAAWRACVRLATWQSAALVQYLLDCAPRETPGYLT
jgi:hypothetical protein